MKTIKLLQTCGACPEQYDAYIDGESIGYLRLRHGYFYAEYCDTQQKSIVVFNGNPLGDGSFDEEERDKWLRLACAEIVKAYNADKGVSATCDDPLALLGYDMEID